MVGAEGAFLLLLPLAVAFFFLFLGLFRGPGIAPMSGGSGGRAEKVRWAR